jgi:hypothetical protein
VASDRKSSLQPGQWELRDCPQHQGVSQALVTPRDPPIADLHPQSLNLRGS